MSLQGKTALVTGGTGGLGSHIVKRFLAEKMNVAVSTLPGEKAEGEGGVMLIPANVADEKDVASLFARAIQHYKGVDIVVNTVGGFLPAKPLTEVTLADWDKMMTLNLTTAFLCTREALRTMKGRPYGRIVNIAAMVGLQPTAGRAPYAISKAGVAMLTEIAAREVKGTGITINAIAPSIIDTPANRSSMPDEDFSKWVSPESIAETIVHLCSQAGGAVSGTTLRAVGGL